MTEARASLPMYNLPEMRRVNAAFWEAVRIEATQRGARALPDGLDFDRPPVPEEIGRDVVFTQVCGFPFQTLYRGQGRLLAAPVYGFPHCDGARHCGVFVVAADAPWRSIADLRGSRFAFNSVHSNSGMNLPRFEISAIVAGAPFFGSVEETHSQPGNIERVAAGEADATCVDCVTYGFFRRWRPERAARTRVLAATRPTPSIPFATSVFTPPEDAAALREALFAVARAPRWRSVREGLALLDIVEADPAAYGTQLDLAEEARRRGYPDLV